MSTVTFITFRVSRRRHEMYSVHGRLCVSVCLSLAACPHYCTDPDVTEGMIGVPSSCALLGGLQSVHRFRCYDNIARTRNVSECLYSLYAWLNSVQSNWAYIVDDVKSAWNDNDRSWLPSGFWL